MDQRLTTIPARRGAAAHVRRGQTVRVVNTHGDQVVDTWAFNAADMTEHLSMEHSRAGILKVAPRVGEALLTNRRRPILTLVEGTSGGVHDMLMAACDRWRYEGLGCTAPTTIARITCTPPCRASAAMCRRRPTR